MDRLKLKELAERLDEEIEKSGNAAGASKKAANEASSGLIASYSVAGDVEHAKNSALLSLQKVNQLKKLKEEIDEASKSKIPETISPACFISIKFENGSQKDLYFVENPVFLNGFNLISPESPLGKVLTEKGVGDSFSYSSNTQTFHGSILSIE
jgi:transcription elongation GreA/GreB family factor